MTPSVHRIFPLFIVQCNPCCLDLCDYQHKWTRICMCNTNWHEFVCVAWSKVSCLHCPQSNKMMSNFKTHSTNTSCVKFLSQNSTRYNRLNYRTDFAEHSSIKNVNEMVLDKEFLVTLFQGCDHLIFGRFFIWNLVGGLIIFFFLKSFA